MILLLDIRPTRLTKIYIYILYIKSLSQKKRRNLWDEHMGASKNRGTPKMVYDGKPYQNG